MWSNVAGVRQRVRRMDGWRTAVDHTNWCLHSKNDQSFNLFLAQREDSASPVGMEGSLSYLPTHLVSTLPNFFFFYVRQIFVPIDLSSLTNHLGLDRCIWWVPKLWCQHGWRGRGVGVAGRPPEVLEGLGTSGHLQGSGDMAPKYLSHFAPNFVFLVDCLNIKRRYSFHIGKGSWGIVY